MDDDLLYLSAGQLVDKFRSMPELLAESGQDIAEVARCRTAIVQVLALEHGHDEIAALLGISKARVGAMARRTSIPEPDRLVELEADLEQLAKEDPAVAEAAGRLDAMAREATRPTLKDGTDG